MSVCAAKKREFQLKQSQRVSNGDRKMTVTIGFFSTKHFSCVQIRWYFPALAGWLDSESESATSTVVAVL
jgi:hypothetical protein